MSKHRKSRRQRADVRQGIDERHRPGRGPKFNQYRNPWGSRKPDHLELQDEDLEVLEDLQAQRERAKESLNSGKRPMKASAPGAPNWYGSVVKHEGNGCYARCAEGKCPNPECKGLSSFGRLLIRRFKRPR